MDLIIYNQTTGCIYQNSKLLAVGYAGNGPDKNNKDSAHIIKKGPLPCGLYLIGDPQNVRHMGLYVLHLRPVQTEYMKGRSAFYIHGDSITRPGTASEGCIILPRNIRNIIASSGINLLLVVPY